MDRKGKLRLVMLLHDLGKAATTQVDSDGTITSHGHDVAGVDIAKSFLDQIGAPKSVISWVLPLVRHHMVWHTFDPDTVSDRTLRRLAQKVAPATLRDLIDVIRADISGRGVPPSQDRLARLDRLSQRVQDLDLLDSVPVPILKGRHLINLGLKPSPAFGVILRKAFDAQLSGSFTDVSGGVQWLQQQGLV